MSPETISEYHERVNSMYSSLNILYIIAKLGVIIDQLDVHFANAKNLILELARQLDESKQCKQRQICRKIKELLEDKIKEGKISKKWIEECLPQEYKRKYTNKSEVSSLSKQGDSTNEQLEQALTRKTAIITANQISANQIEFRIPKEKYPQLKAAMDDSINSVCVIFDKSGVLEGAEPDTFREKLKNDV